jgi:hypothetical protein
MRWNKPILLIALAGLAACSPDDRKDGNTQAKAAFAKSRPIGHTPEPVKTATSSGPLLFHGYACGSDCIGHQEGYSWAADHLIADPAQCRGTSETFLEGCRAFAGVEGPFGERVIDPSFPHMIGTD